MAQWLEEHKEDPLEAPPLGDFKDYQAVQTAFDEARKTPFAVALAGKKKK